MKPPRRIFKYSLIQAPAPQTVVMPADAIVVKFGVDPDGLLCVWASVQPDNPSKIHALQLTWTGDDVPLAGTYVDSTIQGSLVWHLFALPNDLEVA